MNKVFAGLFIHLVLVVAIIVELIRVIQGRPLVLWRQRAGVSQTAATLTLEKKPW